MNDFVVLIRPQAGDVDGPLFLGAIAQSTKTGPLPAREMIPSAWGNIFQRRFLPQFEVNVLDEVTRVKEGITHLSLLTGDCDAADPFFFGKEPVNGASLLCWYNADTDLYHFVHCRDCAVLLSGWLAMKQEEWNADDLGTQEEARTLN